MTDLSEMIDTILKESENCSESTVSAGYDSLFENNALSKYNSCNSTWDLNDQTIVTTWKTTKDGSLFWRVDYSRQKEHKTAHSHFSNLQLNTLHKHNYMEITYIVEGRFVQIINGKQTEFHAGDIYIIDSRTEYCEQLLAEDGKVVFIGFSNSFFSETMFSSEHTSRRNEFLSSVLFEKQKRSKYILFHTDEKISEINDLIELTLSELLRRKVGSDYLLRGYSARLLSILAENFSFSITASEKNQLRQVNFRDLQEYLFANYKDVSIKDLQKKFHYEKDYFNRLIFEKTGHTYTEYLQEIRLSEAARLIKETDISISTIASEVGYDNLGFFYKIFKNRYGLTPRHYRINSI